MTWTGPAEPVAITGPAMEPTTPRPDDDNRNAVWHRGMTFRARHNRRLRSGSDARLWRYVSRGPVFAYCKGNQVAE
jgi:hypothetical protein